MSTPSAKSIVKAIHLVEVVCGAPAGLALREAAAAAQLPLATTHRILTTLRNVGAITCAQDGTYTLGPRLVGLHTRHLQSEQAVRAMVHAHMAEMLTGPAMCVRLCVLESDEIFIFAGVDRGMEPEARTCIGARYEAYCTALGKVLLSTLSDRKLDDYIFGSGFVALTNNTIVVPTRLAREIKQIRATGYAFDNREFFADVQCVAVPVCLAGGQVIAALGISSKEMQLSDLPRLVAGLSGSAASLAKKLAGILGGLQVLQRGGGHALSS